MNLTSVKLAYLATVSSGGGAPQDSDAFSLDGIPFVRAGSLIKLLEGLPEDRLELLRPEVAAAYKLKLFPAGTVVFAKSGMSAMKGHIYQLKNPAYIVNHLATLTPHSMIFGKYLRHVLQFKSPTCLIKDEAYPSIRLGDIEQMEVPAPNDDEDKARIAAILDQVDELRRKRKQALDRLNQLSQAIFHEMFGDLATNANKWPRSKIVECCEVNPKRDFDLNDNATVSFLPMAAVSDEGYILEEKTREYLEVKKGFTHFRRNDVLIAKITPCFENGKGTIARIKASEVGFGTTEFHVIRPSSNVTSRYIFDVLHSYSFRKFAIPRMSGSAGQKRVPADVIKDYELRIPPSHLLEKYEVVSNQIDIQKFQIKVALGELDALFQSLQQRAFRGEL